MENPLDLLSRAATFIHEQMKTEESSGGGGGAVPVGRFRSQVAPRADLNSRDSPAKDLPTKAKKERRKKENYDGFSKIRHPSHREYETSGTEGLEAPLDMSTSRRAQTASGTSQVQLKPAISISTHQDGPIYTGSPAAYAHCRDDKKSQRREIISSGVCDPVIDEHFRRSLGDRYSHLFASPPTASSPKQTIQRTPIDEKSEMVSISGLSVDDHFAKALGETWVKLQSDSGKEKSKVHPENAQSESHLSSQQHCGLVIPRIDLLKNV